VDSKPHVADGKQANEVETDMKLGFGSPRRARNDKDLGDTRLPLMLAATLCAAVLVTTFVKQTLPIDAVLPALAAVTFAAAAFVGVAGVVSGRGVRLAMFDVAGVLTFVGIFTAAAVEPEQMMRLMQIAED
jgi:hypothetical protein